jgi:predicted nucleic acid-binding Zn finger protein
MTTLLVSETDPRGPKAVQLAADAGQWAKVRTRDGRKLYGIRSSDGSRYYLVNRHSCTCPDFAHGRGRDCKHVLAVHLWCALIEERAA